MRESGVAYLENQEAMNIKNFSFIVSLEYADGLKKNLSFNAQTVRIGRAETNDLILNDSYASRKHAVIHNLGNGEFKIKAFNSQNGIYLNNRNHEALILKPGDRFQIGKTWLSLELPSSLNTAAKSSIPSDPYVQAANSSHNPDLSTMPLVRDEFDDDDENDEDETPAYSMRQLLLDGPVNEKLTGHLVWEVVTYRDELIFDSMPLQAGRKTRLGGPDGPMVMVDGNNYLKIKNNPSLQISFKPQNPKSFTYATEKLTFDGWGWADAPAQNFALEHLGVCYRIRRRHLPSIEITDEILELEPRSTYVAGGLAWLHIAAIMVFSVLNPPNSDLDTKINQEDLNRFASIAIEEFQPQPKPTPPPPAPKIQQPIETTPTQPTKPTKNIQRPTQTAQKNFKVRTRNTQTGPTQIPDVSQVGALGKLGGTGLFSPKASSSSQLVAAVSNVTGVRAHGGVKTFAVSGNIGGMPGREVRFARITDVGTRGGTPMGDGFGAASVGAKTNRKVKGLVVDISPPPIEVSVQGGLTRAEIAAVVQQHVSEIRYCYEKGLLDDPSLSGKIAAKWTISPAGSVSTSGIASSTVRNSNVHSCLVGQIQSWNFPKPRNGGAVLVSFPFVFNSSSF
ncbi:MAG: FHA domain-containing protein [Bdellovibrionales bacterium]|nr:FHA domain-containing protein [Bdellovibrionales bacterium]